MKPSHFCIQCIINFVTLVKRVRYGKATAFKITKDVGGTVTGTDNFTMLATIHVILEEKQYNSDKC